MVEMERKRDDWNEPTENERGADEAPAEERLLLAISGNAVLVPDHRLEPALLVGCEFADDALKQLAAQTLCPVDLAELFSLLVRLAPDLEPFGRDTFVEHLLRSARGEEAAEGHRDASGYDLSERD